MTQGESAAQGRERRTETDLLAKSQRDLLEAISCVRESLRLVRSGERGAIGVALGGEAHEAPPEHADGDLATIGTLPPLYPEWLGDRGFAEAHGCRFPYVVGEMARGITTPRMVVAAARAGLMAFFGSAGLSVTKTEAAIQEIQNALGPGIDCWGANLIHSPNEPGKDEAPLLQYGQKTCRMPLTYC